MKFEIYCDNQIEGAWFKNLSSILNVATIKKILGRGENPRIIDQLIEYDRPDIILMDDGKPTLVVEKTREVPTGHNVGQRFARLVRAVEGGISTIVFFPFDAMKHGDYAGVCNLNIRLLKAFERMTEIHGVPILAVNWPCDKYYELIDNGSENERVSALVHDFLRSEFNPNCSEFRREQSVMTKEYERRLGNRKEYANPPPSVKIKRTDEMLAGLRGKADDAWARALRRRPESLIYTMEMTPEKCRREDPYTGTQFIYDYLWCRSGPKVEDKHRNLILNFPKITKRRWYSLNPDDRSRKSCNWYLTANVLLFADEPAFLRG